MQEIDLEAIGRSEAFLGFQSRLSRAARVNRPVLLIGERGTGKELAARKLHFLSPRWSEPLVTLNCAAMTPSLLTSELFGHEAGAFTGAERRRTGRFEAADRGSLFLDELGHIPPEAQEKILRVVEYKRFERVGSSEPTEVDVRLIGATHTDLAALAAEGRFKPDLLDRLSFEVLFVPPLRERRDDILLLASHFASRMARELDRPPEVGFSDEAAQSLLGHPWPGNIRELKNVVERAVYRTEGPLVAELDFDPFRLGPSLPAAPSPISPAAPPSLPELPCSLPERLRELEIRLLRTALAQAHHRQNRAAELLGLSYHQFRGLYRKHRAEID
ncbi:MAG: sigma 54-interacting transcriptional regulator [Deltaproteobacteria bacterium]|nr:sigma 54-interacting transcriptional regulator [Deltaproteobacteria bacterium]